MSINFKEGTVAYRIYSLGQSVFETKENKEIAELIGVENQGQVSNERGKVARETGWKLPGRETATPKCDKPRKLRGSLPLKIQGYLEATVDDVPDVWEPEKVLEVVLDDSAGWNRLIRRLNDADQSMIESFEAWLDHAATVSRTVEFEAKLERARLEATRAKIESLARQILELDSNMENLTVGYLANLN